MGKSKTKKKKAKSGKQRRPSIWWLGGAATVLSTAAGLWLGTDLQKRICGSDVVFGTPPATLCQREYQEVSQREATIFLDTFLGRASGARPQEAWDMLSPEKQAAYSLDEFEKAWGSILWAERTEVLQSMAGNNEWLLRYRSYSGRNNEVRSGLVRDMSMEVTVQHRPDSIDQYLSRMSLPNRLDESEESYPRIRAVTQTKTYNRASTSFRVAAPKVTVGAQLTALCLLQRADGSQWFRTPLGWIQGTDVRDATAGEAPPSSCDPINDDRALDAEASQGG